jgi:hypothetical protein
VRHARNISIKDVSFTVDKPDARPAVVLDDVQGATSTASAPASLLDRPSAPCAAERSTCATSSV